LKAEKTHNAYIPKKRLHSIKEGAKYLGCGVFTVRQLVWSKRLPVVTFGKKQYIDLYDLDNFIDAHKV